MKTLFLNTQLLCIDEATASVDQKTDKLLQQTIRERFRDQTVLTIAHRYNVALPALLNSPSLLNLTAFVFCVARINTVMDCDRVLVMHAGKVVEFDSPAALCQTDRSVFHRLVAQREE